jgi:hypothetical protein
VDFIETQGVAFPTFSTGDGSMDFSEAEDEAPFKLGLAMGDDTEGEAPLTAPGFATGDEYMDFAEVDSEETFTGHSLVTGDGVL